MCPVISGAGNGAPNLHTLVGLAHPGLSLSHFLSKRVATLQENVREIPIPDLFLISGAGNRLDVANLAHEQKMKMLRAISRLDYDYILLDLDAGTSFNILDFFTIFKSVHALGPDARRMKKFLDLNFYELLEVPFDAPPFAIRQAYKEMLSFILPVLSSMIR